MADTSDIIKAIDAYLSNSGKGKSYLADKITELFESDDSILNVGGVLSQNLKDAIDHMTQSIANNGQPMMPQNSIESALSETIQMDVNVVGINDDVISSLKEGIGNMREESIKPKEKQDIKSEKAESKSFFSDLLDIVLYGVGALMGWEFFQNSPAAKEIMNNFKRIGDAIFERFPWLKSIVDEIWNWGKQLIDSIKNFNFKDFKNKLEDIIVGLLADFEKFKKDHPIFAKMFDFVKDNIGVVGAVVGGLVLLSPLISTLASILVSVGGAGFKLIPSIVRGIVGALTRFGPTLMRLLPLLGQLAVAIGAAYAAYKAAEFVGQQFGKAQEKALDAQLEVANQSGMAFAEFGKNFTKMTKQDNVKKEEYDSLKDSLRQEIKRLNRVAEENNLVSSGFLNMFGVDPNSKMAEQAEKDAAFLQKRLDKLDQTFIDARIKAGKQPSFEVKPEGPPVKFLNESQVVGKDGQVYEILHDINKNIQDLTSVTATTQINGANQVSSAVIGAAAASKKTETDIPKLDHIKDFRSRANYELQGGFGGFNPHR